MVDYIVYLILGILIIKSLFPTKFKPNGNLSRKEYYDQYIHSAAWRRKRRKALKRDGYQCQYCGKYNCRLEVHHLSYKNLGNEHLNDLITLCSTCHQKIHNKKIK